MSDKTEIIKKTSQEKIEKLLIKIKKAKVIAKRLDNKIKILKSKEHQLESEERVKGLIEIAILLVGEDWKRVHGILKENPEKVERMKGLIKSIIVPKRSRVLLYLS